MPTESPIKKARESRNLSRRQFAAALGVSYSLIGSLEAGDLVGLAPTLRPAFEALELDFPEIQKQYAEWRAEWAAQVRKAAVSG